MPFDENTNFIISQSVLKDVLAQLGVYVALGNINPKDKKNYDSKELQAKIWAKEDSILAS